MVLTREDLNLLKQLKASGERGRTTQALEILQRLGRGGYVVGRAASGGALVNYRITRRGEDAIIEHDEG
jgi:hypothetical protein